MSSSAADPGILGDAADLELVSHSRLLKHAFFCVVSESAFQVALLIELGFVSHAPGSSAKVPAYAAVSSTVTFFTALFNFLLSVTMAQVGKALGSGDCELQIHSCRCTSRGRSVSLSPSCRPSAVDRLADTVTPFLFFSSYFLLFSRRPGRKLGDAVTFALLSSQCCAALAAGALAIAEKPLWSFMGLSSPVQEEISTFFYLRLAALPFLLAQRCLTGVITGYARFSAQAVLSLCNGLLEIGAVYLALFSFRAGLRGASIASLAVAGIVAALQLVVVLCFPPEGAKGRLRICCGGGVREAQREEGGGGRREGRGGGGGGEGSEIDEEEGKSPLSSGTSSSCAADVGSYLSKAGDLVGEFACISRARWMASPVPRTKTTHTLTHKL